MNVIQNNMSIINRNKNGYLQLVIGPMFSGKTSEILTLYKQYVLSKMNVLVVNYAEDKRYDDTKLSNHDKVMIDCYNCLELNDILLHKSINDYDVILVNEGQFFNDLKKVVLELVENKNKIVHVCGLDGDFKRNGFSQIMELIPLADNIQKRTSICMKCEDGTPALFSHRLTNENEVKVIGASNYIPVCRKCYLDLTK